MPFVKHNKVDLHDTKAGILTGRRQHKQDKYRYLNRLILIGEDINC